jgi:hypothetical protein
VLSNRPLFDNPADAAQFVHTREASRFIDAVKRGRNSLLEGAPGSGKTTVLRMLQLQLREAKRPVAYVGVEQADSVHHAALAIYRVAYGQRWLDELDDDLVERALRGDDPFVPNQIIRALGVVPSDAVFLIDGIGGVVGHALFGRLRDELWQLRRVWGVAVDADQAATLLQPPADPFFEVRIRLGDLSFDEQRELLELRHAPLDSSTFFDANVTPRRLIEAARRAAESGAAPQDLVRGSEARRQLAEKLAGRPAAMLVAEMENLGAVSASDERLLTRLGWTRPRAAQLLKQLEGHGVVESRRESRGGPGQPRKVYELRDALEFADRMP